MEQWLQPYVTSSIGNQLLDLQSAYLGRNSSFSWSCILRIQYILLSVNINDRSKHVKIISSSCLSYLDLFAKKVYPILSNWVSYT